MNGKSAVGTDFPAAIITYSRSTKFLAAGQLTNGLRAVFDTVDI